MADLDRESATAIAEYLRRKATGGLLTPDPHLPDSETVTMWARAMPRLVKLLNEAKGGSDVSGAALDILEDRDPVFQAAAAPAPGPTAPPLVPLANPPQVGDVVWVDIDQQNAKITAVDTANATVDATLMDGSQDRFDFGDLYQPQPMVAPGAGPGGTTVVSGLPTVAPTPHTWSVGDRVQKKNPPSGVDPKLWTGTVASLPSGPVVTLGSHTLGNEMGVDLDGGGRAVADVDEWIPE